MDSILLLENIIKMFVKDTKIKNFESKLLLNNSKMKNFKGFLKWGIIEGIFSMIITMILISQILQIQSKLELFFLISIIAFFTPLFMSYLFHDVLFEKRKREKEELLSDLLLEASIFCDESSATQTIKRLSEQDFPLLKEDFKRAYTEITNGASIEEALLHVKELNQSKTYSRVIDLLIQGYKSGAKISELLKETAEDLLEMKAIIKERQAVMLVTKYTLIIASGLIVPAILGLIIGLVAGLNFNSLGELSFGLSTEQRKALFETAISGTTIYVFEYASISSFFLALQEGNKKNFWIYALVLVPLAGITFFISKNLH
ncbi:MAG: type II secretion system F family protein [archaeon]